MSKAITEANTLGDRSDLRTIVERVLDMPSSGRASSCELATTILDALTPALDQPSQEPVDPGAIEALKNHQRQLDADGVFVGVSREALDMVLASLSHPSREISIKPLSWLEGSWGRELAYGIDGKYAYEVRGPFDGRSAYWMHQGAGLKMVDVETIEAAKAAAQKDFETRIRSALSVPLPEIEGGDKGDGWQPIDTAPKDETDILLADCRVHGGFMTVASYEIVDGSEWVWHTNDGPSYHTEAFTHWRHLPAAPSASIEGETKP